MPEGQSNKNVDQLSPKEIFEQIGIKPVLASLAGGAVSVMNRLGISNGTDQSELASDKLFELIPRINRMATCVVRFKPGSEKAYEPVSMLDVLSEHFSEATDYIPHTPGSPLIGLSSATNLRAGSPLDVLVLDGSVNGLLPKEMIEVQEGTSFFIYNTPQGFNITFDHAAADALQMFPLLQRILTRTEFHDNDGLSMVQGRNVVNRIVQTPTTHARDLLKAAALSGKTEKGEDALVYVTHMPKEKRIIPYPVPVDLILDEQRRRRDMPTMLDQSSSMSTTPIAQAVDLLRLKRVPSNLGSMLYRLATAITPTALLPKIAALTGIGPVQKYEKDDRDINHEIGDIVESISIDLHMYPKNWKIPLLFRVAIDLPGNSGIVPIRSVSVSGLEPRELENFSRLLESNLKEI